MFRGRGSLGPLNTIFKDGNGVLDRLRNNKKETTDSGSVTTQAAPAEEPQDEYIDIQSEGVIDLSSDEPISYGDPKKVKKEVDKIFASSNIKPQINPDGTLRTGKLPQHHPKPKRSPYAPSIDSSITGRKSSVQNTVYNRVCDEWAKIADPETGFDYFCRNYVWISNQRHGYVQFKLYGYQERLVKAIQGNRYVITRKFRQAGASLLTGVYCLWYSLVKPRMQCMIVSIGLRESSKYLQENVREIYEALPQWLRGGLKNDPVDPETNLVVRSKIEPINYKRKKAPKDAATEMAFPNRSKIRSVPTGKAGGRGFSTKLLIIDEAAFIEGVRDFYVGVYPTINAAKGSVFVISTVNGVGGIGEWYYRLYKDAEEGNNKFTIAKMEYTEHPDYNDPEWVADTKANLGPRGWRQEVLGEFLASGSTFIDGDHIAMLEEKCREPIRKEKGGKLWIWKDPVPDHRYAIGADCATKGGLDRSACHVVDLDTGEQAAEYVNKMPEDEYAKVLAELGYRYGTALIAPEINATAGGAVTNSLNAVQRYKRIYRRDNGELGWQTTVRTRDSMISYLESTLYDGSYKIYSTRTIDELKTFIVTKRGKIEHDSGSHDDALMAWMITIMPEITLAARKHRPVIPMSVSITDMDTTHGFTGTVKPVYSDQQQMEMKRKERSITIAGTDYGEKMNQISEMNEKAGEDILGWLLN